MTEQNDSPLINPNFASEAELQALAGVGPGLAQRIHQGGPYEKPEDLLKVSGVGKGSLARWQDRLTFEASQAEDTAPPAARLPGDRGKAAARRTAASGQTSNPLVWMVLAVILSVFLSVSLTLGILLSINGTLNTGRHRQVQSLNSDLAEAQSELANLQSQLDGIEERVASLQGLSGRMASVEDQVGELESQMNQALTSVEAMRQRFDTLEQTTRLLGSRVDRFDRFLDGLQELLVETSADESPGALQEATPSQ